MNDNQIKALKDYIAFLEKRLEHSTAMHEQAMEMVRKLIEKLK